MNIGKLRRDRVNKNKLDGYDTLMRRTEEREYCVCVNRDSEMVISQKHGIRMHQQCSHFHLRL